MDKKDIEIPEVIKFDKERASRFNKRELDIVYSYLSERDGNECAICHKSPEQGKLQVDHVDGNKRRHFHQNLQLLCASDNSKKNSRGKSHKKGVDYAHTDIHTHTLKKSQTEEDKPKARSLEFLKNSIAEPKFRHWIKNYMQDKVKAPYRELVDGGAEIAGVQVERAEKYLRKMCSVTGRFILLKDEQDGIQYVLWKSNYSPFKEHQKKFLG